MSSPQPPSRCPLAALVAIVSLASRVVSPLPHRSRCSPRLPLPTAKGPSHQSINGARSAVPVPNLARPGPSGSSSTSIPSHPIPSPSLQSLVNLVASPPPPLAGTWCFGSVGSLFPIPLPFAAEVRSSPQSPCSVLCKPTICLSSSFRTHTPSSSLRFLDCTTRLATPYLCRFFYRQLWVLLLAFSFVLLPLRISLPLRATACRAPSPSRNPS